ncbi:hypothetical protein [Paenibacillus illinoisensis]|uniref:hypothetical protein n=1 Tax=Paenibacillus illinoisensis TaxID=59845 RepID=UPI0015E8CA81|nr:hypothetical protein [Paenibacillus illinoisensis]
MYKPRGGTYNEKLKLSSLILSAALLISILPATATSFEDVFSVKYSWATEANHSLTSQGIIKGYVDMYRSSPPHR